MLAIHQQANSVLPSMPPLENLDQRRAHLALLFALLAAVLDPDSRFLDVIADVDDRQRRQDADPQHAAPADIVEEQAVDHARQQKADAPRALQNAAHKAARAHRPLLHRQRRAGRPFGPHADARASVRNTSRNKKVGENPAMKLQIEYQKIEIISGVLRPIRSASQPEATAPTSRIHKVRARIGDLGDRERRTRRRSA